MKVTVYDFIWAVVSMIIVGVSYRQGRLSLGLILIYVLMVALFAFHILRIKRKIAAGVAVYGEIIGYETDNKRSKILALQHHYPVVRYETEDGLSVEAVYKVASRQKNYVIGDTPIICYNPQEPEFFCFSGRENELTDGYFRFIKIGGAIAVVLLLTIIF